MKKIILYIAQSLDGFIAGSDGNLDWLEENNGDLDFGYSEFIQNVDTTIMGSNTYKKLLTFPEFPYSNLKNYVFTKNSLFEEKENVSFIQKNYLEHIKKIKNQEGKDIFLIGGGILNTFFLDNNLIDKIYLFIKSVAIGDGIPIFSNGSAKLTDFNLVNIFNYEGKFALLEYNKINY